MQSGEQAFFSGICVCVCIRSCTRTCTCMFACVLAYVFACVLVHVLVHVRDLRESECLHSSVSHTCEEGAKPGGKAHRRKTDAAARHSSYQC